VVPMRPCLPFEIYSKKDSNSERFTISVCIFCLTSCCLHICLRSCESSKRKYHRWILLFMIMSRSSGSSGKRIGFNPQWCIVSQGDRRKDNVEDREFLRAVRSPLMPQRTSGEFTFRRIRRPIDYSSSFVNQVFFMKKSPWWLCRKLSGSSEVAQSPGFPECIKNPQVRGLYPANLYL
jgi:hypothetical protein